MRFLILFFTLIGLAHADTAVLDAWLKRQPSINSLDTTFTQERKLPALKIPTSANGRLSFVKPGKFRGQLGEPVETLAVSDGTTLTLIESAENELTALELELQDKSRVRTIFHSPKINTPLPDSLFKPDLTGITIK